MDYLSHISDYAAQASVFHAQPVWQMPFFTSFFFSICVRYEQQEIALNCGAMLRECIRYEALTKILLNAEEFYDFFKYVEVSTFDIASDAFATFKVSTSNGIIQYACV